MSLSSDNDSCATAPKFRKHPVHLLLIPVAVGAMGLCCYSTVWFGGALATFLGLHPQSFSSYQELTKILIVIPALLAAMPFGFIVANLLVYSIPAWRRCFVREARGRKGEDFATAMRGLLVFSKNWMPPLIAVSLGAALFGP